MNDPKRWLDGGDASDAERDLLRGAGDVEPREGSRAAIWASLGTRLPPVPGEGGGGAGGTNAAGPGQGGAVAAGGTVGAKTIGVAALTGALLAGAVLVMRMSSPDAAPPPAVPALATAASAAAITTVVPATPFVDGPSSPSAPSTSAFTLASAAPAVIAPRAPRGPLDLAPSSAAASVNSVDALREESALLGAARGALRGGDGAGALASLESARTRFPNGPLLQEREVLTIEALAQTGDTGAASRRASSFLRRFPSSPHATHVQTFVR